jgi:hypothetical protein
MELVSRLAMLFLVGISGGGTPVILAADIGYALVRVPVLCPRECLIQTVIEILVMRENDMAADIIELDYHLSVHLFDLRITTETHKSFRCDIG